MEDKINTNLLHSESEGIIHRSETFRVDLVYYINIKL